MLCEEGALWLQVDGLDVLEVVAVLLGLGLSRERLLLFADLYCGQFLGVGGVDEFHELEEVLEGAVLVSEGGGREGLFEREVVDDGA